MGENFETFKSPSVDGENTYYKKCLAMEHIILLAHPSKSISNNPAILSNGKSCNMFNATKSGYIFGAAYNRIQDAERMIIKIAQLTYTYAVPINQRE